MTKRHFEALVCAGLTIIAAGALAGGRDSSVPAPTSAQLRDTLDVALRRVVLEWSPEDIRPIATRRRALADFVYATYGSSAWVPQSLFDSNLVTQAVIGDVPTIVGEHVGLVLWRDNPLVTAFGMAPNADDRAPLKWTVNCVVCHTAEIDGVTYFGAGTKSFDEGWLSNALKRLTSEPWLAALPAADYALAADANRILNSHHHDRIDSLTRARSTAFAASHVELFMRSHGNRMPPVDAVGRGDVKTPPLWHAAAKMPVRRWYADGSFAGTYPLMASSMELEKDRPFDALVRDVIPVIKQQFDDVVQHLRPPRYPYPIDRALAARGRQLFSSKDLGCSGCHGTYDGLGNVDWPGVHVDIGTDRSRLDVVNARFIEAFDRSPLATDGTLRKSSGYAATPLTGVWANYPYLHNGSVPTLHHLLGPVSERPRIFEVKAARIFDRTFVGQPRALRSSDATRSDEELLRRVGGDRDWFSTARPGSANGGHDVWSRIGTDENRRALIEYLKTL
jgi:hypothetical protein